MSAVPLGHVAPELAVAAGAIAALLIPLFVRRERQWIGAIVALLSLTIAAVSTAYVHDRWPVELTFSGTWALDVLTMWGRWIVLTSTAMVVILSPLWFRTDARHGEWYSLLLLSGLGALVLVGAADMMELMLGMLLTSVTGYTLASYHRGDPRSAEAGAKYFLLGALTNPLLLIGIALLYGLSASTRYEAVVAGASQGMIDPVAGTVATALVIVGLALELGAVPAHPWVPDVAQASPAPAAAFLTVVPKVAALFALARFVQVLPVDVPWRLLVAVISLLTMTVGNLAALRQNDVRRMLGWSSVSQAGYGLIAIAALGRSELALGALVVFAIAYAVADLGAFAVVIALRGRTDREGYRGLAYTRPWLALAFSLCLLSLAGIPVLVGFTAKLSLFGAALEAGLGWLALAAVINTVISLVYYLAVIARMTFPPWGDEVAVLGRAPLAVAVTLGAATVVAGVGASVPMTAVADAQVLPGPPPAYATRETTPDGIVSRGTASADRSGGVGGPPAHRIAGDDGFAQLVGEIRERARRVRHEDRVGVGRGAHVLERVEVLGHEHEVHHVLRRGPGHALGKLVDRLTEAIDDRLALFGDASAGERLGLRIGLGCLDLEDAVGLTLLARGNAHSLRCVDLVHRTLDVGVGLDVGDERLHDAVAEVAHHERELVLHGVGDVVLLAKHVVDRDVGHPRTHDVEHEAPNLR